MRDRGDEYLIWSHADPSEARTAEDAGDMGAIWAGVAAE